jgi:axin 1
MHLVCCVATVWSLFDWCRYFFKTECNDLDMKVIQEEITDDNEVLPLWEGKIMAQVKPVE